MKTGPFNADNVTAKHVCLIASVLRLAAGKADNIEAMLDQSEITPAEAAETLNSIHRAVTIALSTDTFPISIQP